MALLLAVLVPACDDGAECVPESPPAASECTRELDGRFVCDGCGETWVCNYSLVSTEPSEWNHSTVNCRCIDDDGVFDTAGGPCVLER
ncbi:MAG: hypothetical protein FJ102_02690 [Deltaproteobacteria bacterium]|nr:hypothetical protein [Deltaproteobacteria bacterium]